MPKYTIDDFVNDTVFQKVKFNLGKEGLEQNKLFSRSPWHRKNICCEQIM